MTSYGHCEPIVINYSISNPYLHAKSKGNSDPFPTDCPDRLLREKEIHKVRISRAISERRNMLEL